MVTSLSEVTYYSDPLDQWAAQREFELRRRAWSRYRFGIVGASIMESQAAMAAMAGAMFGARQAVERFGRAWAGVPEEWQRELEELKAS